MGSAWLLMLLVLPVPANAAGGLPTLEAGSPWWVVLAAAVLPCASGAVALWRWFLERGDKHKTEEIGREERLMQAMDARIATAAKIDADLIAQGRTEIARLVARCDVYEAGRTRLEADRDRGWDLARWWYRRTIDLWHAWANRALGVNEALARAGVPPVEWPTRDLPPFEDPYPPRGKPE